MSDISIANPLAPDVVDRSIAPPQVARIWLKHLVSLVLPGNALVFLMTGPHPWYIAPLFLIPLGVAYAYDGPEYSEERQPDPTTPAWCFDVLVYVLAGLQFWIIFELARLFTVQHFFSIDTLLVFVIVGGGSGFSIITAHELIHRKSRWEQQLGRLLLCTVLNEHFYTEHLRGHHVRVGTPDDPATARFGESFQSFYWRTIRGQFKSAWQIERRRLGDPSWFDVRMLQNRILHGLAVGWGLAIGVGLAAGWVAFAAFLVQAFSASRLLEAVNYFEHWGLRRKSHRVSPRDSWDTHAWFTYYGLTGLSRHADHHAEPARPFQQLRVMDEAPILPGGYVRMVDMVIARNAEFQQLATEELERRQLGPFDPAADEADAAMGAREGAARDTASAPEPTGGWLAVARRVAVALMALVAITFGMQVEAGPTFDFAAALGWNLWVAIAFAAWIAAHEIAARRFTNDGICWAIAFAVLLSLGFGSEQLLG